MDYNEECMVVDEQEDVELEVVSPKSRCQRREITELKKSKQIESNKIKQKRITNYIKKIKKIKKNKRIKDLERGIKKDKNGLKKELIIAERRNIRREKMRLRNNKKIKVLEGRIEILNREK
ncbi:hypothetical protein KAJ38_02415 [Candidatus Pacearchaeota archaeon]|nr:hypothetical protein [Candidatus Pacearchaeota archaeon]